VAIAFDLSGKRKQVEKRLRDPLAMLRAIDRFLQHPAAAELFGEAGETRAFTEAAGGLAEAGVSTERQAREGAARGGFGKSFAESLGLSTRYGTAGGISRLRGEAVKGRAGRVSEFFTGVELPTLGETQEELQTLFQQAQERKRQRQAAKRSSRASVLGNLLGPLGSAGIGLFGSPEASQVGAAQYGQSGLAGLLGGGGGGGLGGLGGLFSIIQGLL